MGQIKKPGEKIRSDTPAAEAADSDLPRNKKGNKAGKKGSGALLWILLGGGAVLCFLFLICAGGSAVGLCVYLYAGKGVTLANYNKLRGGMTEKEVIEILGSPTRTDPTGVRTKTCFWESGKDSISVGFLDDKVYLFGGHIDNKVYIGNEGDAEAFNKAANQAGNNPLLPPNNNGLPNAGVFPPPNNNPPPNGGVFPPPNNNGPPNKVPPAPNNPFPGTLPKDVFMPEYIGRFKNGMTEAECIAAVGILPIRLGPQPMTGGGLSDETFKWSNEKSMLRLWFIKGKVAAIAGGPNQ
jgi:hypothetical protein